jgi:hypothetical protein
MPRLLETLGAGELTAGRRITMAPRTFHEGVVTVVEED